MHLLGVFLSPFKLICCILFITEVFDKTTPWAFDKAYSYGWWDVLFCETEEKMASTHRHGLMLMLTMINGEYYLCMWNKWIWGQKEGTEFAVNAKIISGVFWNNFTATRKSIATLHWSARQSGQITPLTGGLVLMSMMINWGVLTLHVKRVDSEAEKKARNLLRSNRPSITHKTSTLTTGANIYLQQRWW